jgi:hypothetical protein
MALINPSTTLTEIVTTTLRNRTGKLADNITKNNGLIFRLKEKENVKPVSGGRTIVQELEYAENGTYKRYSGYEALNISPSDVFTGAEYNYAQAAVAISISGLEMIQNAGEEAIIDLLESRIKNGEKTITNNIALDCYSDGSADGGRQIGGLALLVSKTPATHVLAQHGVQFSHKRRRASDLSQYPVVHESGLGPASTRRRSPRYDRGG